MRYLLCLLICIGCQQVDPHKDVPPPTTLVWLEDQAEQRGVAFTWISGDTGTFNMPEVVVESKIPGDMFSHEVTYQLITAIHGGEEYELWNSELRGIDEPDEYKQKLSSLNADLVSPNVDFIRTSVDVI